MNLTGGDPMVLEDLVVVKSHQNGVSDGPPVSAAALENGAARGSAGHQYGARSENEPVFAQVEGHPGQMQVTPEPLALGDPELE